MNLLQWDKLLEQLISDYNLQLEIISPYGFEVAKQIRFQKNPVSRFYIYYKGNIDEAKFEDLLIFNLAKYANQFFDNVNVIGSRRFGFKSINCLTPDNTKFFIAIEKINTSENLLENYSRYIACSYTSLGKGTLPELKRIEKNAMARLRIRQLFIIYRELYGDYFTEEMINFANLISTKPSGINFISNNEFISLEESFEIEKITQFCSLLDCRINRISPEIVHFNFYGSDDSDYSYFDKMTLNLAQIKVKETYNFIHNRNEAYDNNISYN